jgi:hypothetical protein
MISSIMGIRNAAALSAITAILLLAASATADAEAGSVCVASRRDDPWWKVAPPEATNTRGFRVKIDKRPAEPWPQRASLKIDGLDREDAHLLVILDGAGKPVESVHFKFSSFKSADLCMTYDGYQGMQLQEATKRTPWCKCK